MEHVRRVTELIAAMAPGAPRSAGGLTLVPVAAAAPAGSYMVAADAFAAGLLTISEMDGGTVPEVLATNEASVPVLVIDGEHIEGAMQNRVLNATILIPPRRTSVLPVSCVEHGRWHYERDAVFAPSEHVAYSRLRAKNARAAGTSTRAGRGRAVDQGEVWADVESKHAELGVDDSATGAMRDAFDHRRGELDDIVARLGEPEPGQTGVVACVGGRPVALDAFDRPETLARMWTRLVSGYAMDALGAPPPLDDDAAVTRFLGDAAGADATAHEGVGLGTEVVLTSDALVGHALAWGEGVVHLALFARADDEDGSRLDQSTIASPSRRRIRYDTTS